MWLILQRIRAEDHGLNADEHGKDGGFGALPFGFGRTWKGTKEAKAYYLVVSRTYAMNVYR